MLRLDSASMFGSDGSGNQKKQWIGEWLYKVDSKLHESTKEVSASNIASAFNIPHVDYYREKCRVDDIEKWCCKCRSFLTDYDAQAIPLNYVLSLMKLKVIQNTPTSVFFEGACKCVQLYTNLDTYYIRERLLQIITFDFLIANTDRHLSNIEIIEYPNGSKDIAPIYDNGQSFFGRDSVLTNADLERLSHKYKSRPFSTNQWKNLIDIKYAKDIALNWKEIATQKYGDLDNIPYVHVAHKKVLKYRMKLLLNKKTDL